MKVRTKRKVVSFLVIANSKTYTVKLFVKIKGTASTRELFTTPDYWISVIRLWSGLYESVDQVKLVIVDQVNVATKTYNISVLHRYADLWTEVISVTPEKA